MTGLVLAAVTAVAVNTATPTPTPTTMTPAPPPETPAEGGLITRMDLGALSLLGEPSRWLAVGPDVGINVGWAWPRLTVGGRLSASTHEATVPAPPVGEVVQLYTLTVDTRLTALRLGRLSVWLDGRAGLAYLSTNVLERVGVVDPDEHASFLLGVGAGIDWQLLSRHFSVGLGGSWSFYPGFDQVQSATGSVYLQYLR